MQRLFTFVLLFVCLLGLALTTQAQMAYTRVVMPEDILLSANIDTSPDADAPKVLYGSVQGLQGALPGATVWLHGSRTVAVANAEGYFELPVPAGATEVEVTCSYAGLQEEVLTLPLDEASSTVYLLRAQTPGGKHFTSDLTLKNRADLLVKKVLNASK